MKRKLLTSLAVLLFVTPLAVFPAKLDVFDSGRLYLGGSASVVIDTEEYGDPADIKINPDFGLFASDNFLLSMGMNMRFQGGYSSFGLNFGADYYLPFTRGIIPYLGAGLSGRLHDDFSYIPSGVFWIAAHLGIDFMIASHAAFFAEVGTPAYYFGNCDAFTGHLMPVNFGFHFYVPDGAFGLFGM